MERIWQQWAKHENFGDPEDEWIFSACALSARSGKIHGESVDEASRRIFGQFMKQKQDRADMFKSAMAEENKKAEWEALSCH